MWTHSCVFLSQWSLQLSRLHDSTWASIKTLHIAVRSHIRPKHTKRFFFFLRRFLGALHHGSRCSAVAFLRALSPTQCAPPCSPAHLPGPLHLHHGLCDAARDINKKSWSRNHSAGHRGERQGCRLAALIRPWWQFDGATYVFTSYLWCLRSAHQLVFSPLWRGIFLWQAASEKAIKNSQTAHHNARYHFVQCVFHVPCSFSLQWAGYF